MLPLTGGLIMGGASLLGGLFGASSASKAAKAQAKANQAATAEARRQFDAQMAEYQKTQRKLSPYIGAGTAALDEYMALMGMGGTSGMQTPEPPASVGQASGPLSAAQTKTASFGRYGNAWQSGDSGAGAKDAEQAAYEAANKQTVSPEAAAEAQRAAIARISGGAEMQALSRQGEEAIMASAAATGGLRGGNTASSLAEFRPQLLNSLINQRMERLAGISAMGQSSILGSATSYPSGGNVTDLMSQGGAISAGGAMAQGQAWSALPNAISAGLGAYAGMGGGGESGGGGSGGYMPWGKWGW